MSDKCDERHSNCKTRFTSQADDIGKLFDTKASSKTLYWTLGILILLVFGSFGYTQTVAEDIKKVVTKGDMKEYQRAIIEAIKEGR